MTNKFDRIHTNTNKKYIIRNCPAIFYSGITPEPKCWQKWEQFDETCQNCTDCIMKQIVEKCKETLNVMKNQSGVNAYAGGRCVEAERTLKLLDIQEVE